MDGLTATRAIRALDGPCARVPIIALTANAMASDEADCRAAGMNDYIAKPIDAHKLADLIRRWGNTGPQHVPTQEPTDIKTGATTPAGSPAPIDASTLDALAEIIGPAGLATAQRSFLADVPERLQRIAEAVARADLGVIERETHALKGAAETLGASALAAAAKAALAAAREHRAADAMAATRGLDDRFAQVRAAWIERDPSLA
jgi:CheY-like chemotaxis protein